MELREDLITQGSKKIALLKESCDSKFLPDLDAAFERTKSLCVEASDDHESAFEAAHVALDNILNDCPKNTDLIHEIKQLFNAAAGVKCGNGYE